MLTEARALGYSATESLFEDWVQLGLLDEGRRRGHGRGRGVTFVWPESQRGLWLLLLDKRREVRRVRVLANLPVAVWLFWGDTYVPLRQVRRAMATWAEVGRRGKHNWERSARGIVRKVASPAARRVDVEVLVDAIASAGRERVLERDVVEPLLVRVVGKRDATAFTDGPRVFDLLHTQWTGLTRLTEVDDYLFEWARAMYLVSRADYLKEQPALACDPRFGQLHAPVSFESLVQEACRDLVHLIGIGIVHPVLPNFPPALQPQLWREGQAKLASSANYHPSPLLLPAGMDAGRIRVDVHIQVDH